MIVSNTKGLPTSHVVLDSGINLSKWRYLVEKVNQGETRAGLGGLGCAAQLGTLMFLHLPPILEDAPRPVLFPSEGQDDQLDVVPQRQHSLARGQASTVIVKHHPGYRI